MALPIADHWFETRRYDDDVTLIWEPHVVEGVRCNIWHVRGRDRDLLIDSGMGLISLRDNLAVVTEKPILCVATHTHIDHVGGHYEFAERLMHPAEAAILSAPDRRNTVIYKYVTSEICNRGKSPGGQAAARWRMRSGKGRMGGAPGMSSRLPR